MVKLENEMKYFVFLKEVIKRDIKKKYYKSALGVVWTVLHPLLYMLVMTLVFSTLFRRNIENYPVYMLSGQLVFSFIRGSGQRGMTAITGNAGFLRSIYVPKYIFVVSRVVEAFVDMFFSLLPLFLIMLFTGAPFTFNLLLLPLPLILVFMFGMGLAFVLATYGTFLRDIQHIYGIFSRLWMWTSCIFYPVTIIPSTYRFLFDLNPALHYINIIRAICYEGTVPTEKSLIIATCYSALMLAFGISLFRSKENQFVQYV